MSLMDLRKHYRTYAAAYTLWHFSIFIFIHINMSNHAYGCMSPACAQISLSEFSKENTCLKCQRVWKCHSVFYQVLYNVNVHCTKAMSSHA